MQVEGTSLTPKKRFRVGGITYYYRLGKLQACPSKRITLKKKIRKDENGNIIPDRTPKQRKITPNSPLPATCSPSFARDLGIYPSGRLPQPNEG